jgi:glycosyltransferase involved in cell wall biosynthesis
MPPRRKAPVVVTIHDAVPWTHPETLTPRGVDWHHRMGQRAADDADLVTVDTEAVARELSRHLDIGDRIRVLGAGWSLVEPLDAGGRRRHLGLPTGYLAFVGTVEPRKGLDVLLDALTELDLPLVVIGPPGWGGVDLESEARRRRLTGGVYVLGRLADDDLAAVVSGAVALVVPSRAEGFGLPLLEAMALGTPVVASDDPALIEVGEGASLHSPIGDSQALARAVAEVAGSTALREQMRARGFEVAARRTWQSEAKKMWGFYHDLIG